MYQTTKGKMKKTIKLSKRDQEIYDACQGHCMICLAEGGCSLEKKLKKYGQKQ